MEKEYNDDQIGELDEDEIENPHQIKDELLIGAVDDFIEDKKTWFRDLYQKHGDYKESDKLLVESKNAHQLREIDIEDGEDRE